MISKKTLTAIAIGSLFALQFIMPVRVASAYQPPQQSLTQWDVNIPPGTRLAAIKNLYNRRRLSQAVAEPSGDLQDQSPLPLWFRLYFRDKHPNLPREGRYQYPRVARQVFEWMVAHPNLETPPSAVPRVARSRAAARTVSVGGNINLTNFSEVNSESFIARDYINPQFLVAGSNNLGGSGRQKQFFSSDSGATWHRNELPLAPGSAFQSDPAFAFTSDGTAWAATLGIGANGSPIECQVYKSTDHGASWSFVSTVSTGNSNDKELMWIDPHPGSSFRDNIYLAWDVPGGGMRFVRSTDKGATWSSVTTLSSDVAIGCHLTTGPDGALYVAWPDLDSRELRFRKSTDGGATFADARVIATTKDSYEVSIPAMCERKVLIYLSIGVDRSNGPHRGTVYASWTDRDGTTEDPGCSDTTSAANSNIYFSSSTDGGNTWSAPKIIHDNPASTDQFNQWMDVDPDDGSLHVIYYNTKDDTGRHKTHLYYIASTDGGATWVDETRISTAQTDETVSGADPFGNQYGDYNGLVAYRGVAFPSWTDRRTTNPDGKEQIYTARISRRDISPPDAINGRAARAMAQPLSQGEKRQDMYPTQWEVRVPQGSKLDQLKKKLLQQIDLLPERDIEDKTPIPIWFRVYLRKTHKDLPTSGPYQYPKTARRILQQMLSNPNSVQVPPDQ